MYEVNVVVPAARRAPGPVRAPASRGRKADHCRWQALGLSLALLFGAAAVPAQDGPDREDLERVWVKFRPGAQAQVEQALKGAGAVFHYRFDDLGAFAVSLPPQALAGIGNNPNVEYVEPDAVRMPLAQSVPYGVDMVQGREVWDADRDGMVDAGAPTGKGVLVCIIDSGLHPGHQDLAGIANVTGSAATDWSVDTCSHGTHVAGTIAAVNNEVGVVGVSPGAVDLHIVRVFSGGSDGCGWSYSSTLVAAANECAAAANGRKVVINMSLGGSASSSTERSGFQSLFDQGVLSVAAAGNGGDTSFWYPASYDSVISVAAVDSTKALASFSQRNSQVELAAPGKGVRSTVPWASAGLVVGANTFEVSVLDGSFQGSADGALANGGRCTAVGAWSGKVVLCERGDNTFAEKVANVAAGGGVSAVVYNDVAGEFAGSLGLASAIPAIAASQETGQYLIASQLGAGATASSVFIRPGSGYQSWSGTSMATPHVTAVAALVWSAHPELSNQTVRQTLAASAQDLGDPGRDDSFGWGLVQAKAALDALGATVSEPPPPEPAPGPTLVAPSQLLASAIKTRGQVKGVSLGWTPGSAAQVDVYRNGALIATLANTGGFTDGYVGARRSSATFKVCIAGDSSACSNSASVRY